MPFNNIYKAKRVFVTGHTGFKGSWLCAWLLELGAEVGGYSLDVPTSPANFEILDLQNHIRHYQGDLRDRNSLLRAIQEFRPDIVIHLGAQALVRRSYRDPVTTFETNILGTMNVLECARQCQFIRSMVIITSDKCYRNVEWEWGYRENDILGGQDPYSASKGCAELVVYSYIHSFFPQGTRIASTRAGNVIGGGDWSEDRVVPDVIRAWSQNKVAKLRNSGSTRPWQHVLEPLSGYLWLGAKLWDKNSLVHGQAFNFGPDPYRNQSVEQLIKCMANYWPGAEWKAEQDANSQPESKLLKLSCDKALNILAWKTILSFEDTLEMTIAWYRSFYGEGKERVKEVTKSQIETYSLKAEKEGLQWALS